MKSGSSPPSLLSIWRRGLLPTGILVTGAVVFAAPAQASNCNASDTASLAACITAVGTTTITLTQNITLTSELPAVQGNITINGAGNTLDGGGQFRGFFVANFAGSSTLQPVAVTIENVTIQNAVAQGGAGGSGSFGGGGGAGLGGAIFVASGANVTVSNVALSGNAAIGGKGGAAAASGGVGGGGGLGAGGAIFVESGGTLIVNDNFTVNGNTVTHGTGTNGGHGGAAFGSGIFFEGNNTLTFNQGAGTTANISNVITDQAGVAGGVTDFVSLNLVGTGTVALSTANTYSGGTTVQGGTLVVGDSGALGSGSLLLNAGTTLSSLNTGNFTIANAITISGDPTFNVPTGTTLTITNSIQNGASPGDIVVTGGGTLSLTALNTYSGSTTVSAGTLALSGTGSIANSSQVNLANAGTAFDISGTMAGATITTLAGVGGSSVSLGTQSLTLSNASTNYAGAIHGLGGLSLTGGTQILSGLNTYLGPTTVNGGMLEVDGSIALSSLATVNLGSALSGTGVVGATLINAGGTLAPGNPTNPLGTLTIFGNLAFHSGALYAVGVNPATSSSTSVSGTAGLTGATVDAVFASGTYVAKQYTILTAAGGVNGTFAGLINTNLPANFRTSLSYDANDVFLNLLLNFSVPGGGLTGNQHSVANALTNFFNANGAIPMAFAQLSPAGLSQASGEIAVGAQQTTFDAMNLFLNLLTDPFVAGRGGDASAPSGAAGFAEENANAYASGSDRGAARVRDAYAGIYAKAPAAAPFEQRWSVWAAGYGGSQATDGNAAAGTNNTTSSIAGTAVGADYRFSPSTLAGFALAGGATSFSADNSGSGRSDLFQAGAFVRHTVGPAYISAALAYGWQDITTNRTLAIVGVDQLRAEFDANAFSGRVEGGYRFVAPWIGGIGLTPYAAGQFTTFDLPSYAERALSGVNTFALAYGSKSVTNPRSEIGIRTDKSFALPDAILTLRGRAAWAHDFDPDRNIAATFQTLPGASFVVNGAAQAHDSALTTASAEVKWLNGWSAAATFEGEFSDVTRSYAGKGVVRYTW